MAGRSTERGAVLFTRAPRRGGPILAVVECFGLETLVVDALRFAPGRDRARLPGRLASAGDKWIALTSARAADALVEALAAGAALPGGARLAALGEETAAPLRAAGLAPAIVAGETGRITRASAAGLADAIVAAGGPRAALFLRGNRARRDLPERLARDGYSVEEMEVYETEPAPFDAGPLAAALASGRLEASVVWSPSAAEAILARLGERDRALWLDVPVVAPGRTTADALASLGASRIVVARAPSEDGLAEALESLAPLASHRADPARARAAGANGGTS